MRKVELLAATAIGLICGVPAIAQDAPQQPKPAATAPAADQAADDDTGIADVVVTASKREATLLDTPIAVSVTNADTIKQAQIRDLIDIQTVVPSLRVTQLQSSANTNFIIRGFGNGANNAGIEPSVGVFIDGVYRSRSAAQIADLPNLKRVEVLRGPQSTLFGKNASAGIISIVTAEPSFKFGGSVEATYGNYNAFILKGGITGPLTDTLAFSIDGNVNRRDGYVRDVAINRDFNDRGRYGFRGQLLFQPSSDLKFRIIGDYDNIDEVCCGVANLIDGPTGAIIRGIGGNIIGNAPFAYQGTTNFASTNFINNYGISVQGDKEFKKFTLTSIASFRGVDSKTNQDSDFTSADLIEENKLNNNIRTYTLETRLASNFGGRFEILLGNYFFDEFIKSSGDLLLGQDFRNYANVLVQSLSGGTSSVPIVEGLLGLPSGTIGQRGVGRQENYNYNDVSYSFFGSADFKITPKLTFTAGFNYTNDSKKFRTNDISTDAFSGIDLVAAGRTLLTQQAIATTVGQALGLPAGTLASAAQVQGFAAAQPAIFGQIQAGATAFATANQAVTPQQAATDGSAATTTGNPLLPLQALQFFPPFLNVPNAVEPGTTADDDVSYNFRLSWKPTTHLNLYVTYATGFKASSINLSFDSRPSPADFIPGSPVTNPAASAIRTAGLALPNLTTGSRFAGPEKARVIEGGIKYQGRNLAANVAIFNQSISGFQGNIFTGTGFVLSNAGKESTFGIEFDSSYTPVKPLTLNFSITYLDPIYDSFPNGSAINAGLTVSPANLTGQRPSDIPDVSLTAGGTYTWAVASNLKLLFHSDYHYESPTQITNGINFERKVEELNLSVTAQFKNGLEVTGWARNLTDARYILSLFPSVAQAGSISGYPSQPRTYGATVRFKF